MIVRKIRPGELKRTKELFATAFEMPFTEKRDAMELYEETTLHPHSREDAYLLMKYAAFLDDDETMTSCLSAIPFAMNFDGRQVKMAGIGGVSSLPHFRRTGGIRGCFEQMLPVLYREGYLFSALYPFSTVYYGKFGYGINERAKEIEWKLSMIPSFGKTGHTVLVDAENREEVLDDIKQLYRGWQSRFNGMIVNEAWEYSFVTEADPYKNQEFVYVCYNDEKIPEGYMVFKIDRSDKGQKLICSKFVFSNMEGMKRLLALAKTFASDHVSIIFSLPKSIEFEPLVGEWSFGAVEIKEKSLGMIRVVNVLEVLKSAAYVGDGQITIGISDTQIEENRGSFFVEFQNGKAVHVEKKSEDILDSTDLVMEISEFSSYIMGCYKPETGSQVFYKKPVFLMEYF